MNKRLFRTYKEYPQPSLSETMLINISFYCCFIEAGPFPSKGKDRSSQDSLNKGGGIYYVLCVTENTKSFSRKLYKTQNEALLPGRVDE
jgi:hypothetical protein